jgi:DNA polymerase-4
VIDAPLPIETNDARPLRVLFLDLNAYFASVEQQEDASLRGRPVAVCPVMADTSFVIAASYEAKAYGVRTGTQIGEAKRLCPDIVLVHARPPLYTHYHERVVAAVETVLPIDKVCSIDEMRCRLIGDERAPENARAIAQRMKRALRENAGEHLTASVGIAPNAFLAKLATDMEKPDGLVVIEARELPERLSGLKLTDFAGINRRMQARLQAAGIFGADDLIARSPRELRRAFGSILGERWWYLLRGYDLPEPETSRKSLSHSHVLPPHLRHDEGCRQVMLRLLHKAAARLRSIGCRAGGMTVSVRGRGRSWEARARLDRANDSLQITRVFLELWPGRSFEHPIKAGVVFYDLVADADHTPSLFDEGAEARRAFSEAVDRVNRKFGKNTVYLAGLAGAREAAPERIAFDKTWLFSEGAGDNEWPSTRHPPPRPAVDRLSPDDDGSA